MIDDYCRHSTLGLRAFSGIVDDEWIKVRQEPKTESRVIILAERHTAAWQPFEVPVFAKMHNGMRSVNFPNPKIEREILRRRRQSRL